MTEDTTRDKEPPELEGPEADEATTEPAEPDKAQAPRRLGVLMVGLLSVLALAGLLVLGLAGYREAQRLEASLDDQRVGIEAMNARFGELAPRSGLVALRQQIEETVNAVSEQTDAQTRRIDALQDAIGAVHAQTTRSQRGWIIAEAEYLMRTASYRLHLARDVGGAIAALTAADQRLRELADPSLLPVREKLADELQMLRSIEQPDLVGIDLRLDRMITGLKPLPLAGAVPQSEGGTEPSELVADQQEKSWAGLAEAVWSGLSEHIRVRTDGSALRGLPDAEAELYLHQMLRLRLEAARLALLRADDVEYHRQLAGALAWIDAHFDADRVASLRSQLVELDAVDLRPELPDVSGSLELLASLTATQATEQETAS
jgi:uroporphyrin-3 C-methyltransferase